LPPEVYVDVKKGPMLGAPIMPDLLLEGEEKKPPYMDPGEDGMCASVTKVKNGVS